MGYKGLQWATRGYIWLQAITSGDKRLRGVTRGYRELQGVLGGDKGF